MNIREDVLSVLNKSNWTINKENDISKIQIEFVENFAFLKITFNNHYIDINPFSNYVDNDILKIYEDYFKVSLIPIGLMRGPNTYLFIKKMEIYTDFLTNMLVS